MTTSSVNRAQVNKFSTIWLAVFVAIICFLVYLRTLGSDFVNIDDPDYVLRNVAITHFDSNLFYWAFTTPHAGFWMPLTWISLALDYKLWGFNPLGYHLTNIVLHAVNTGLVVLVADKLLRAKETIFNSQASTLLRGRYIYPATILLAALLWGLHPLRVESVAWVTERKDVLNGFFFLGSLLCYLRYQQYQPLAGKKYYFFSLFLFAISLMAKSVSVVLPAMLIVADWYPYNRLYKGNLTRVLTEKLPFFIFSAIMAIATIFFAAQLNIMAKYDGLPILHRVIISGSAIFEYCRLIILPVGILPLHVIDISKLPIYIIKTALVVTAVICVLLFRKRRWLVASSLCFIIPLLPVLAFFQNGVQIYASRFTYLPSIVPSIAAASIISFFYKKLPTDTSKYLRIAAICLITIFVAGYATWTWRLIGVWKNSETVWSRIIDIEPTGRAYKERGVYYLSIGNNLGAADDLTKSIEFALRAELPQIYNLYAYRGVAFDNLGQHSEAVDDFSRALSLCSRPNFYFLRGRALEAMQKTEDATGDFRRAGAADGTIDWEKGKCD